MFPIIQELLSDPAWGHCPPQVPEALRSRIRLDHDNIHHEPPAADGQMPLRISQADGNITGANALHGGPGNWHITCAYELRDVPPGGGGFGACPGSHTPAGWGRLSSMDGVGESEWRTQWCDSKWSRKHPAWDPEVPVHRVEGQAGDCILFTSVASPLPLFRILELDPALVLSRDGGRQGEDDARDNPLGGAEREADTLLCAPTPTLSPLAAAPDPMADG